VANDHSTQNEITNGLGLIPGLDWPMAITGAFNDLFLDYLIYHNDPLAGKTWQDERLIDSGRPSGDSGEGGTRDGGGPTYDLGECQRQGFC